MESERRRQWWRWSEKCGCGTICIQISGAFNANKRNSNVTRQNFHSPRVLRWGISKLTNVLIFYHKDAITKGSNLNRLCFTSTYLMPGFLEEWNRNYPIPLRKITARRNLKASILRLGWCMQSLSKCVLKSLKNRYICNSKELEKLLINYLDQRVGLRDWPIVNEPMLAV